MTKTMLIDAAHAEETRVFVVDEESRIVDLDIECSGRKQTIGNIYLAKVTRIEPSLQAAFVEYGGGRQGFLPFSEIHPDYYQIPVDDRVALRNDLEEMSRAALLAEDELPGHVEFLENDENHVGDPVEVGATTDLPESDCDSEAVPEGDNTVETQSNTSNIRETIRETKRAMRRRYKIQEVIRKRQVLLMQVTKEERGNKGAAVTTYLSIAGRYCVLMPNRGSGMGISRKISNPQTRHDLKQLIASLSLPEGMGLIVRTAGEGCSRSELKRDLEYLVRLWERVRTLTLRSVAPCMIYEERSLVKRCIRDMYSKDVSAVVVQGIDAYREARDYMKVLMPSHLRSVTQYREQIPLSLRYNLEVQMRDMMNPVVPLKSGGYIVINMTEALIAIDVNSGKSTNRHSIEETAISTNLEASEQIARQLYLRDLAGLVVIDFIDMENESNRRTVEKSLYECLRPDRARIQMGRISRFGLLEMTRQRLRPAMQETFSHECPHCQGRGYVLSAPVRSVNSLRAIIEYLHKNPDIDAVKLEASPDEAEYLLNQKRETLLSLEKTHEVSIYITGVSGLTEPVFLCKTKDSKGWIARKEDVNLGHQLNSKAVTKAVDEKLEEPITSTEQEQKKSPTEAVRSRPKRRGRSSKRFLDPRMRERRYARDLSGLQDNPVNVVLSDDISVIVEHHVSVIAKETVEVAQELNKDCASIDEGVEKQEVQDISVPVQQAQLLQEIDTSPQEHIGNSDGVLRNGVSAATNTIENSMQVDIKEGKQDILPYRIDVDVLKEDDIKNNDSKAISWWRRRFFRHQGD